MTRERKRGCLLYDRVAEDILRYLDVDGYREEVAALLARYFPPLGEEEDGERSARLDGIGEPVIIMRDESGLSFHRYDK